MANKLWFISIGGVLMGAVLTSAVLGVVSIAHHSASQMAGMMKTMESGNMADEGKMMKSLPVNGQTDDTDTPEDNGSNHEEHHAT